MTSRRFALTVLPLFLAFGLEAEAGDLGFRYNDGRCVNARGETGFNPGFLGQCGDLRNVILGRFNLTGFDFSGAQFTNADLQQSVFNSANLTGVSFEAANLSGVQLNNAVLHNVNAVGAILRNIQLNAASLRACDFSQADFTGAKLDFVVFNSSKFTDTIFAGVSTEEVGFPDSDLAGGNLAQLNLKNADLRRARLSEAGLVAADLSGADLSGADLSAANLRRALFIDARLPGASLQRADVMGTNFTGADLTEARLEGAIYNEKTLLPFSQDKAQDRGMILNDQNKSVLVIWDVKNAFLESLLQGLRDADVEVTLSDKDETTYTGEQLEDVRSVIHLNGPTFGAAPPLEGQRALTRFVREGGTYIALGWNGYEVARGAITEMSDLVLLAYVSEENTAPWTPKIRSEYENHPVVAGLTDAFTADCDFTRGVLRSFEDAEPPMAIMMEGENPTVAIRNFGLGRVVDLASAGQGNSGTRACLSSPHLQTLLINAIAWE